jgi:hypothetical protein
MLPAFRAQLLRQEHGKEFMLSLSEDRPLKPLAEMPGTKIGNTIDRTAQECQCQCPKFSAGFCIAGFLLPSEIGLKTKF